VAELLRARGLSNVLVNIGEIRAVGASLDGHGWKVAIPGPRGAEPRDHGVSLVDRAIATSATSGTVFDDDGRFGHIIDPRSGRPAAKRRQVSVIARSATLADAYSTAFCLVPRKECQLIADARGLRILEA
jgi:thiamine biosynthesis lipoprotein